MNGATQLNLVPTGAPTARVSCAVGARAKVPACGPTAAPRPGVPRVAARPVPVPRSTRQAAAPVRLTRRGRAGLLGALIGVALVGGLTFSQNTSVATDSAPLAQSYEYVVIEPGQTLWQIARRAAPGVDPRVTIDRILELNALPGADIRAGERIALP